MSIGSTLGHVLGFVAGLLIPGANKNAVVATSKVQQTFADLYGPAATALAAKLKLDETGMSGPDKVFYITKALVETAKSQGFKGDLSVLGDALLDVAQTAYRNSEPDIESKATALLISLHLSPTLTSVAELVLPAIVKAAEQVVGSVLGVTDEPQAA